MTNWWHIARTPDGAYVHQLDPVAMLAEAGRRMADDPELGEDEAMAEVLGDEAGRIRGELGFPPKGRWVSRPGWSSHVSEGEPHPSLLAAATVHRGDGTVTPPTAPMPAPPRVRAATTRRSV